MRKGKCIGIDLSTAGLTTSRTEGKKSDRAKLHNNYAATFGVVGGGGVSQLICINHLLRSKGTFHLCPIISLSSGIKQL